MYVAIKRVLSTSHRFNIKSLTKSLQDNKKIVMSRLESIDCSIASETANSTRNIGNDIDVARRKLCDEYRILSQQPPDTVVEAVILKMWLTRFSGMPPFSVSQRALGRKVFSRSNFGFHVNICTILRSFVSLQRYIT